MTRDDLVVGGTILEFFAVSTASLIAGVVLVYTNWHDTREINLYAMALMVQSLPYVAAAGIGLFESSRFNDYAFWRALHAKMAPFLPRWLAPARSSDTPRPVGD